VSKQQPAEEPLSDSNTCTYIPSLLIIIFLIILGQFLFDKIYSCRYL